MTKKMHLVGISKASAFEYPRLDPGDKLEGIPRLWYGHCALSYRDDRLKFLSGAKVEEAMDLEDFGLGATPVSFCSSDPDVPKALFSLITGISPEYLDPKRFREIKPGNCRCKHPVKIHMDDPSGSWDKFVCARCLKLVKTNEE